MDRKRIIIMALLLFRFAWGLPARNGVRCRSQGGRQFESEGLPGPERNRAATASSFSGVTGFSRYASNPAAQALM
jgi:hypothetical protein